MFIVFQVVVRFYLGGRRVKKVKTRFENSSYFVDIRERVEYNKKEKFLTHFVLFIGG